MHARVLEGIRQTVVGDAPSGYWSAPVFLHHLRPGVPQLRTGALAEVTSLRLGNLSGRPMGDEGVGVLAGALDKGALPHVAELRLQQNEVTDAGLLMLANAIGAGALARLHTLDLSQNAIGDFGFAALAERSAERSGTALKALVVLDCAHNDIGAEGVSALLSAVGRGGLPLCAVLDLSANQVSDGSAIELAGALRQPASPPAGRKPLQHLAQLRLEGNPFGDVGTRALASACADGALAPEAIGLTPRARQILEHAISEQNAPAGKPVILNDRRTSKVGATLRRLSRSFEVNA